MKFTKVAIVIVFILSLCAFGLTAFLSTVRQNEKEKRLALEDIKVQLESQIQTLQTEKSTLQAQIPALEDKLRAAEKSVKDAQDLNNKVRAELADKDKQLEERIKNVEELQRAVQLSQDRNHELEETLDRLEKASAQINQAQTDLAADAGLNSPKEGFQIEGAPAAPAPAPEPEPVKEEPKKSKKSKKEKKAEEAAAIPAPSAAPAASQQSIQAGKVLLVNRKFNFVVMNMGVKQGIKIGDTFMVATDKEKVAKVEVEKLYDDFAAAKIVEQFGDKGLLKEGNMVTRL